MPDYPTIGLIIAVLALGIELLRRKWFVFNDAVPLQVGVPFINRPPKERIRDVHDFDKEYTWKHRTTVVRSISPLKPWARSILVGDPALLKEIYVGTGWEKFDRGHPYQDSMQAHAGGLILMKNGTKWREAREALGNRTFSSVTMRTYVPILREQFGILIEQIEKERVKGDGKMDLQHLYSNLTFDLICRLVFGESVNAQTTEEGQKYLEAWDGVLGLANILALLQSLADKWIWRFFPSIKSKHQKDVDMIYSLVDRNLARRKRGEDLDRVSILDDLFRNGKVPGWLKEDAALKAQLTTLLFAGHDTTAALLSFLTYELARHPDWQSKVREEILSTFGTDLDLLITDLDKLESLPLLNAAIKETLRLYPSAPYGGGRMMREDYLFKYVDTLTGLPSQIEFRKGDQIRPSMYVSQMTPEFWNREDGAVSEWNPERWLKDVNGGACSMYAYAPFGNGARRCAGERLALSEARLTMGELVRRYEWRMQEGFRFGVLMTGTIKARDGVKVVLTPLKG